MEHIKNTIVGAAVGDAMGLMTEFMTREEVHRTYDTISEVKYEDFVQDGHRKSWKQKDNLGDWTDDTDQIICIIKSLIKKSPDSIEQTFAKELITWIDNGLPECGDTHGMGTGNTTSLWWGDSYSIADPIEAAHRIFIYHPYKSCRVDSNGGVMRASVIGLLPKYNDVVDVTIRICSSTHANPKCVTSSLFITTLIHKIVYEGGYSKDIVDDTINTIIPYVKNYTKRFNRKITDIYHRVTNDDPYHDVIKEFYEENFKEFDAKKIIKDLTQWTRYETLADMKLNKNIGFTLKPVACACYALKRYHNGVSFEDTMIEILSEGGDADTNCCVAGSVLGSVVSSNDLPTSNVTNLAHLDVLQSYIDKYSKYITSSKEKDT